MAGILVLWSLVGFLIWFGMIAAAKDADLTGAVGMSEGFEFINPLFVYKHNEVNWFGALVIALFILYYVLLGLFVIGFIRFVP